MPNNYYITTPIYYVNANPHLGHAYTTILADVLQRFHTLLGKDVWFLTGTDEHGEKIAQVAQDANMSPQQFVDNISKQFKDLWPKLNITYDQFIRTTDPQHIRTVQTFLQSLYESGDIYFGEFGGYYCTGCERFYTEKELDNGYCIQHKTKPNFVQEQNYFFRMSKYLPWLIEHITTNPNFIRPERYRKELLSILESGALEDLCISRPKNRLSWGIELPFDNNYVCYVWFDALINYISALQWPESSKFQLFWPGEHIIAKDILKQHGIFWPTMLKSAGIPIYKHLNVHGYWLTRDTKMSKSLGNAIDPIQLSTKYGLDPFRYFLIKEMHFGSDANFSEEALINCINADLSNDLGNLFSRVLSMVKKYFNSHTPEAGLYSESEIQLQTLAEDSLYNYITLMEHMCPSQALETLWELVRALNKYIDTQAPWSLFKNNEVQRLNTVIRIILECMYKVALALWPVIPDTSNHMLTQLSIPLATSGKFGTIPSGHLHEEITSWNRLTTNSILAPESNLFPRHDPIQKEQNLHTTKKNTMTQTQYIEFEDFQKLDLRIGTITNASKHPNADNLLCLTVSLGEEQPRTIVSGIAQHFSPEAIVNKQVCVVANLAPKKIRGIDSQGMIIFSDCPEGITFVTVEQQTPDGSKIS